MTTSRWTIPVISMVLFAATATEEPVSYPQGYRSWVHVKSALVTPAHPAFQSEGGLHHIYANSKAAEGYASGRFSDGSAIVYELLETNEKDGVISEGAVRRVDVMLKDAGRYAASGGWGFERFRPSNQTEGAVHGQGRTMCFECHTRAAEHGYVFSRIR